VNPSVRAAKYLTIAAIVLAVIGVLITSLMTGGIHP
jgi:NhaP-type Na+/H+ and K+/H+ antiporter